LDLRRDEFETLARDFDIMMELESVNQRDHRPEGQTLGEKSDQEKASQISHL
jgi:hypothetical protein